MATIKLYTDIPQSIELAKYLSLESADMYYRDWKRMTKYIHIAHVGSAGEKDLPCWSLAALLNILSKQDFIIKSDERNDGYRYNIDIPSRHCKLWFSSLLDAAFEMVCWLKKNEK